MKTSAFSSQICSVARALEVIGEWWTLLIIREAFLGTRRFTAFENNLGIARNVLSSRLAKLVTEGIMERSAVSGRGNPQDYTLTEQGRDLLPVIIALMQWGDRWTQGPNGAPIRVLAKDDGQEIARMEVRSTHDSPLVWQDLRITPGPGASEAIHRRFGSKTPQHGQSSPPADGKGHQ